MAEKEKDWRIWIPKSKNAFLLRNKPIEKHHDPEPEFIDVERNLAWMWLLLKELACVSLETPWSGSSSYSISRHGVVEFKGFYNYNYVYGKFYPEGIYHVEEIVKMVREASPVKHDEINRRFDKETYRIDTLDNDASFKSLNSLLRSVKNNPKIKIDRDLFYNDVFLLLLLDRFGEDHEIFKTLQITKNDIYKGSLSNIDLTWIKQHITIDEDTFTMKSMDLYQYYFVVLNKIFNRPDNGDNYGFTTFTDSPLPRYPSEFVEYVNDVGYKSIKEYRVKVDHDFLRASLSRGVRYLLRRKIQEPNKMIPSPLSVVSSDRIPMLTNYYSEGMKLSATLNSLNIFTRGYSRFGGRTAPLPANKELLYDIDNLSLITISDYRKWIREADVLTPRFYERPVEVNNKYYGQMVNNRQSRAFRDDNKRTYLDTNLGNAGAGRDYSGNAKVVYDGIKRISLFGPFSNVVTPDLSAMVFKIGGLFGSGIKIEALFLEREPRGQKNPISPEDPRWNVRGDYRNKTFGAQTNFYTPFYRNEKTIFGNVYTTYTGHPDDENMTPRYSRPRSSSEYREIEDLIIKYHHLTLTTTDPKPLGEYYDLYYQPLAKNLEIEGYFPISPEEIGNNSTIDFYLEYKTESESPLGDRSLFGYFGTNPTSSIISKFKPCDPYNRINRPPLFEGFDENGVRTTINTFLENIKKRKFPIYEDLRKKYGKKMVVTDKIARIFDTISYWLQFDYDRTLYRSRDTLSNLDETLWTKNYGYVDEHGFKPDYIYLNLNKNTMVVNGELKTEMDNHFSFGDMKLIDYSKKPELALTKIKTAKPIQYIRSKSVWPVEAKRKYERLMNETFYMFDYNRSKDFYQLNTIFLEFDKHRCICKINKDDKGINVGNAVFDDMTGYNSEYTIDLPEIETTKVNDDAIIKYQPLGTQTNTGLQDYILLSGNSYSQNLTVYSLMFNKPFDYRYHDDITLSEGIYDTLGKSTPMVEPYQWYTFNYLAENTGHFFHRGKYINVETDINYVRRDEIRDDEKDRRILNGERPFKTKPAYRGILHPSIPYHAIPDLSYQVMNEQQKALFPTWEQLNNEICADNLIRLTEGKTIRNPLQTEDQRRFKAIYDSIQPKVISANLIYPQVVKTGIYNQETKRYYPVEEDLAIGAHIYGDIIYNVIDPTYGFYTWTYEIPFFHWSINKRSSQYINEARTSKKSRFEIMTGKPFDELVKTFSQTASPQDGWQYFYSKLRDLVGDRSIMKSIDPSLDSWLTPTFKDHMANPINISGGINYCCYPMEYLDYDLRMNSAIGTINSLDYFEGKNSIKDLTPEESRFTNHNTIFPLKINQDFHWTTWIATGEYGTKYHPYSNVENIHTDRYLPDDLASGFGQNVFSNSNSMIVPDGRHAKDFFLRHSELSKTKDGFYGIGMIVLTVGTKIENGLLQFFNNSEQDDEAGGLVFGQCAYAYVQLARDKRTKTFLSVHPERNPIFASRTDKLWKNHEYKPSEEYQSHYEWVWAWVAITKNKVDVRFDTQYADMSESTKNDYLYSLRTYMYRRDERYRPNTKIYCFNPYYSNGNLKTDQIMFIDDKVSPRFLERLEKYVKPLLQTPRMTDIDLANPKANTPEKDAQTQVILSHPEINLLKHPQGCIRGAILVDKQTGELMRIRMHITDMFDICPHFVYYDGPQMLQRSMKNFNLTDDIAVMNLYYRVMKTENGRSVLDSDKVGLYYSWIHRGFVSGLSQQYNLGMGSVSFIRALKDPIDSRAMETMKKVNDALSDPATYPATRDKGADDVVEYRINDDLFKPYARVPANYNLFTRYLYERFFYPNIIGNSLNDMFYKDLDNPTEEEKKRLQAFLPYMEEIIYDNLDDAEAGFYGELRNRQGLDAVPIKVRFPLSLDNRINMKGLALSPIQLTMRGYLATLSDVPQHIVFSKDPSMYRFNHRVSMLSTSYRISRLIGEYDVGFSEYVEGGSLDDITEDNRDFKVVLSGEKPYTYHKGFYGMELLFGESMLNEDGTSNETSSSDKKALHHPIPSPDNIITDFFYFPIEHAEPYQDYNEYDRHRRPRRISPHFYFDDPSGFNYGERMGVDFKIKGDQGGTQILGNYVYYKDQVSSRDWRLNFEVIAAMKDTVTKGYVDINFYSKWSIHGERHCHRLLIKTARVVSLASDGTYRCKVEIVNDGYREENGEQFYERCGRDSLRVWFLKPGNASIDYHYSYIEDKHAKEYRHYNTTNGKTTWLYVEVYHYDELKSYYIPISDLSMAIMDTGPYALYTMAETILGTEEEIHERSRDIFANYDSWPRKRTNEGFDKTDMLNRDRFNYCYAGVLERWFTVPLSTQLPQHYDRY